MAYRAFSYTALGLIFGGAAGILLYLLLGQVWWLGLTGVGLILGAAIDSTKPRSRDRRSRE